MSSGGLWKIEVNTTTIGEGASIASYLVDSAGNFLTSQVIQGIRRFDVNVASERAEDAAHVSGDFGTFVLAVRNDAGTSMVSADGDYAPLQVDAVGRLRVLADLTAAFDYTYAEDSAHTTGDTGAYVLAVRNDAFASQTSADGDYGSITVDAAGRVGIRGNYTEDSAHVSGDVGVFAMGVRNDANAVLTSADGDYSPLAVDSAGRLKIVASSASDKAEDSASVSGDIGTFTLAIRRDAVGTQVSADGDYAEFQVNARNELRVANKVEGSSLQQVVSVGAVATALPTTALANRKHLVVQNIGSRRVFLGSATVTTTGATQGYGIAQGGEWSGDISSSVTIYGIATAATDVVVWEFN